MNPCARKTPLKALISGLGGILVFLVVLVLLRFIAEHTRWPLFDGIVGLLYANAPLLVFISVLFMIGEIFAVFDFPFNLPFPIFNAIGGVLLVSFLITFLKFFDAYFAVGISGALDVVQVFLLPLTLIVVLIAGYLTVYIRWKGPEPVPAADSSPGAVETEPPIGPPTWKEIGDEFRQMIRDLIRKIRREIEKE